MAMEKYEDMNALELDIIKEIGSIGNGNAATALSSMLDTKVKMTLPEVNILEFNEALKKLGEPEEEVAAVLVEMSGEVKGIMLFLLQKEFAAEVLKRILGVEEMNFTDLRRSTDLSL